MRTFCEKRHALARQYREICWNVSGGTDPAELEKKVLELERKTDDRAVLKARTFALLLQEGQLAVTEGDIFQEKVNARGIMQRQRERWYNDFRHEHFEEHAVWAKTLRDMGVLMSAKDFGHTSSDTEALLHLGFSGLLDRLEQAEARRGSMTETQKGFFEAGRIVLQALQQLCLRFSRLLANENAENAACFAKLAVGAPQNLYEAMQLLIVYFYAHEFVGGTRMRTLGRLDRLLSPFYHRDLGNGTLTQEGAKELLRYFLHKFWTMEVVADMPFALGGMDENGQDVTDAFSRLVVEVYDELCIYSPKIHIRVTGTTPPDFVKQVLDCIRRGNSSFVFVNDDVAVRALEKCGATTEEARNYVIIGCYEPAVYGKELPCTCNGYLNMAKLVELVLLNGRDCATGRMVGLQTGVPDSYEAFLMALKKQMAWLLEKNMAAVTRFESCYSRVNPDPLLSVTMSPCVEKALDIYAGGAKYNNSSVAMVGIGSFADAVYAVKKLVYEEKSVSLQELTQILRENWKGQEPLRRKALALPKYGCNDAETDAIAKQFASAFAAQVNGHKNGRGGRFRAAAFSIDWCFEAGEKTMATPDGRLAGQPLSKNLGAAAGMDRKGVTGLINTVTKLDFSDFPDGSVLDIVLHPTAVGGQTGLAAMYGILVAYFRQGGFALHGNVFDAQTLKNAQRQPEKYANLQVRVCGWNAYFTTLSKQEQEAFIRQAETAGRQTS